MVIKSHTASDEKSSPFYIANENFCREYEKYIASKHGLIRGSYNAWSYSITAKVSTGKDWVLKCNKATFSSSGNLFLSAKKQCLRTTSSWTSTNFISTSFGFKIRKRRITDFLFSEWKTNDNYPSYLFKSKRPDDKLLKEVTTILKDLLNDNKIVEVEYVNQELKIEADTEDMHIGIIDNLLSL